MLKTEPITVNIDDDNGVVAQQKSGLQLGQDFRVVTIYSTRVTDDKGEWTGEYKVQATLEKIERSR